MDAQRRIQELENQNRQLATCEAAINPQDYISRVEAARATASRLAARDEEHAAELSRRIAAVERDAAWKVESREVELIGQSTAKLRQLEEENRVGKQKLVGQVEDLSMQLKRTQTLLSESQTQGEMSHKEYLRVKETVRSALASKEAAVDQKEEAERVCSRASQLQEESSRAAAEAERNCARLAADVRGLTERLSNTTTERDLARQAITQLEAVAKSSAASHEDTIKALQSKVDKLRAQLDSAKAAAEQASSLAMQEAEARGVARGDLRAVTAERCLGDAHRKAEEADRQARKQAAEVEDLQRTVQASQLEVQRLQEALDASYEAARTSERVKADAKAALERLLSQLASKMVGPKPQSELLRTNGETDLFVLAAEAEAQVERLETQWRRQVKKLHEGDAVAAEKLQQREEELTSEIQRLKAELQSQAPSLVLLKKKEASEEQLAVQLSEVSKSLTRAEQDGQDRGEGLRLAAKALLQLPLNAEVLAGLSTDPSLPAFMESLKRLASKDAAMAMVESWVAAEVVDPLEAVFKGISGKDRKDAVPSGSPSRRVKQGGPLEARLEKAVASGRAVLASLEDVQGENQRLEAALQRVQAEAEQQCLAAREEAVQPLRSELADLQASVLELQGQYERDVASLHKEANLNLASCQEEAEMVVTHLQASLANLQAQLAVESDKCGRLEAQLGRVRQDEEEALLAGPPATAVKLERHISELEALRGRVKDLEKMEHRSKH
eukprot:jgi/Botrbrau1/6593/Bobra.0189s0020.1